MDNIKNLLALANRSSSDNKKYLNEAFRLLNGMISKKDINENFEMSTEMCVILAENCVKNSIYEIASKCVQLYFSLDPQENEFLARAFIVQAQLIPPQRFDDEDTLEKPIGFVLKSINFCKKDKRFYYLVYNSSLIYYEIIRNFLRPNFYQYLCKSLSQVCKALEEVNDSNYAWRAQLMLYLLQSHIDAGHKKEIIQTSDATATFIGKYAPHLLKELLNVYISNNVGTTEKYQWYTKNNPEMQVFVRLCRLKNMKEKDDGSLLQETKRIFMILTGAEETESSTEPKSDSKTAPVNTVNVKKMSAEQRCSCLLELAKICLQKSILTICRQSISRIQQMATEEMLTIAQETELINCDLMVLEASGNDEKITPALLKMKLTAIEKCRMTLENVIRSGNSRLIELGCSTLWNMCLPMLQMNIRQKIANNLCLIADSLEGIGCLNYRLSCQVHIEAAKCFATSEQSTKAIEYFQKAKLLDKTGEYSEIIDYFVSQIVMREKLYEKPSDPCDHARQLLGQVQSTVMAAKVSIQKLRPLLAQIGHCLAPDDFMVILDHDMSVEVSGGVQDDIHAKFVKMSSWENAIVRLKTYLQRLGNVDDKKRMNLWVDLVKLSRKLQLWDICRVASCFAILYDDGRWKNNFQIKVESSSVKGSRNPTTLPAGDTNVASSEAIVAENESVELSDEGKSKKRDDSDIASGIVMKRSRYEKQLLENLVEVYFIRAEAFVQSLRNEGAQIYTFPDRPKDLKKHPKGYVKDTAKENIDWKNYCESLQKFSEMIVNCFIRAATISMDLQEPWITKNAATYLWNYSIHVISLAEHEILVPSFQAMYDIIRQMLNEKNVEILVQYGVILAHGMIQRYMPSPSFLIPGIFNVSTSTSPVDKKAKKGRDSPKTKTPAPAAQADQTPTYKKAMEICQYLMDLTTDINAPSIDNIMATSSSSNNKTVPFARLIDIRIKARLIEIWTQCKQLLQQAIGRSLGIDDPDNRSIQTGNIRAITGVNMLWISQNEYYKFTDTPNVDESLQLIDNVQWSHKSVAIQLLLKLCHYTMNNSHTNTMSTMNKIAEKSNKFCSAQMEEVKSSSTKSASQMEEVSFALAYVTFCQGIVAHKSSADYSSVHMETLKLLAKACCYARDAKSYNLVSVVAHYFWTIAERVITRFTSSVYIAEEINIVLKCLSATVDNRRLKLFFEPHTEEETPKIEAELEEKLPCNVQCPDNRKLITIDSMKSLFQSSYYPKRSKLSMDQDLKLRIQMQLAVFQSYFEKEKFTEALKFLDDSINDLPRTNHRMPLFRQRVITKVRLGQSIELDIQKFRNQKEDELSLLWREVAVWSSSQSLQLNAYKNAVEVLKHKENCWLKSDILLEMSQWMFHNDFPLDVCGRCIDWAFDIILNVDKPSETENRANSSTKKKNSGKKTNLSTKSSAKETHTVTIMHDDVLPEPTKYSEIEANSIIGVISSSSRPKGIEDINDVLQLSSLFCCLVFQLKLLGRTQSGYQRKVIMTCACVVQIWKAAMNHVAAAMKEFAKSKSDLESPAKGKDKKEKDKKDKNVKDSELSKSKVIKRKGPIDWLPSEHEEWSLFEVTDEVLEVLQSPVLMPKTGFHANSFRNMGQFMNFCSALVDILERENLELFAFPTLSLMDAISRIDETVPAKVMNQYVHMKAIQICLKLNLSNAASHHENFLDTSTVLSEYKAFALLASTVVDEFKQKSKDHKLPPTLRHCSKLNINVPHLRRKQAKDGYVHELWTEISSILIDLGYNKEASEILFEAEIFAEKLEDCDIFCDVQILKAKLLINQGELENATDILDSLESRYSEYSVKQWDTIVGVLLLIGKHFSNSAKDITQMQLRLTRLKEHVKKILPKRSFSNQSDILQNFFAHIDLSNIILDQQRMLRTSCDEIQDSTRQVNVYHNLIEKLRDVQKNYPNDQLIFEKMTFFLTEKQFLDRMIFLSDGDEKKRLILEKLRTTESVMKIVLKRHNEIHYFYGSLKKTSLSLPIDRILGKIKLSFADSLLEIFAKHVEGYVRRILEHKQKDPYKQIVDEFVADVLPDTEIPEWKEMLDSAADAILSSLNDAHSLCSGMNDIVCKILSRYGYTLKLRAMELNPLDNYQWQYLSTSANSEDVPEETTDKAVEVDLLSQQGHIKSLKITKMKKDYSVSLTYLTQAIEVLSQSLMLSVSSNRHKVISYAAEQIIDVFGTVDPQISVHMLTLLQSALVGKRFRELLLHVQRKASIGALAALVLQQKFMRNQSKFFEANLVISQLYRSIMERLNSEFNAWRITNVSINQQDLLKDLSNIANGFCILQHSPDYHYLYCAFIDPKQKSVSTPKATSKPAMTDRILISRQETSYKNAHSVLKNWKIFKDDLDNIMYKIENKRSLNDQQLQLYINIENAKEIDRMMKKKELIEEDVTNIIKELEVQFTLLVNELSDYLKPCLTPLTNLILPDAARIGSSNPKTSKEQSNQFKSTMILFADHLLLGASLESLPCFKSISARDFSLQTAQYRLKSQSTTDVDTGDTSQAADRKKEKSKIVPRLPILRDVNKKSTKIIPLNRQVPSNGLSVDVNQFRYVVDPFGETETLQESSLSAVFLKELSGLEGRREQSITPRWIGLTGKGVFPSLAEIELYFRDAASIMYINTENILSFLTPQKIAQLNTRDMHLLCCFDRMWSRTTRDRLIQVDSLSNAVDLQSQESVESVEILSLMGFRSMLTNQWPSFVDWTQRLLNKFMFEFFDEGKSLSESVSTLKTVKIQSITISSIDNPDANNDFGGENINIFTKNVIIYGLPNVYVASLS